MTALVKRFEHVGVACADIEKSLRFYRDWLGLATTLDTVAPDGTRVALLDAGGGGLELFGSADIRDTPAPQLPRTSAGVRHFTFVVADMAAAHAFLTARGVEFAVEPRKPNFMPGAAWIAFCKDPDGNLVELIERD